MLNIAMLSTGEEVLHGDILDSNAAWLSRRFYEEGFALSKRSTIGDQKRQLVRELVLLSLNHDIVIVNGGLGPTSDDLTAEAAGLAAEQPLRLFPEWVDIMNQVFARLGRDMPETNLKQAMLPENASILDNPIGTACGFKMKINNATFYFTPGVPIEFKKMVNEQILHALKAEYSEINPYSVSRFYTFGLTESGIASKLDKMLLPDGYELGYRSSLPFIEIKLFGPNDNPAIRDQLQKLIQAHVEENLVGVNESIYCNIGQRLAVTGKQVSIAEIATGGHLASTFHLNESTAGCFKQAWVLNKIDSLHDEEQDPVAAALALAASIREKSGSDIGLSVGKIRDNQVAIALSTLSGEWAQLVELKRQYESLDRAKVISTIAIDMLRRYEEKLPIFGHYSFMNRLRDIHVPALAV